MLRLIRSLRYKQITLVVACFAIVASILYAWVLAPPAPQVPWAGRVPAAAVDAGDDRPMGYNPNPVESRRFVAGLAKPTIRDQNPGLFGAADGQPVLLYRALYAAYEDYTGGKQWRVGKQGIGDCVSWGWAHGADIHLAVMWRLGDVSEWRPTATEAIYGGSRVEARGRTQGGWSDGSYGAAAAKWVKNWGVLHRVEYPELGFDLTNYSADRAKQWGNYGCGGRGDNGRADQFAKSWPITDVALVTTFDEAAAAIQSGYPVAVCSTQGFRSTRDRDGFAAASGKWAHCMVFIGVRFDRRGLLCLNSWGPNWINGPKWPADQPDGSFWVDERTCNVMLGQWKDSFAISGYQGFPARKLDHGDWAVTDPQTIRRRAAEITARAQAHTSYALAP